MEVDSQAVKTVIVIALRALWPLAGGAAMMSEDELQILGGALATVGFVVYQAYRRHHGKKAAVEAIATAAATGDVPKPQ